MRVRAALSLSLLLPLAVQAQLSAPATPTQAAPTTTVVATPLAASWALPVWRSDDGRLLVLTGSSAKGAVKDNPGLPIKGVLAPGSIFQSTGVRWSATSNAYTRVGVNRVASEAFSTASCAAGDFLCTRQQDGWNGAQIGGGYSFSGFTVDVGASWLDHAGAHSSLPVVLPDPDSRLGGMLGVPDQWVDSLSGINASGSMRLGADARVELGASLGRMRMLPGNEAGLDSIDQRALSLGVGAGPVSGTLIGRVMQPVAGVGLALPGAAAQRWSAVDLGISVRFPWEGELSVGARNLWSSGHTSLPMTPTEPAQGRVPYIQYHQEL